MIDQVLERYAKERKAKERTIRDYRLAVESFVAFLMKELEPGDFTAENYRGFIRHANQAFKASTADRYARIVLGFWDAGHRFGLIPNPPDAGSYGAKPVGPHAERLLNLYVKDAANERRPLKRNSVNVYRWVLRQLERHLGRDLQPDDWSESMLSSFIESLEARPTEMGSRQRGSAVATRARNALLPMWRSGFAAGVIPAEPVNLWACLSPAGEVHPSKEREPVADPTADMPLADWLDDYTLGHEIAHNTVKHYRQTVQLFIAWMGGGATVADLTPRNVNGFLRDSQLTGRRPSYRRGLRADLLALWNAAAAAGLVEPPKNIRQVRLDPIIPEAWTPDEIIRLINAAPKALPGKFRTLDEYRAIYFQSLIRTAWDTGLRRCDLHQLPRSNVTNDGIWIQNKTRQVVQLRLRPETLESIHQLRMNRDRCWPLWGSDQCFGDSFRKIVDVARVPRGPFKRIRKSAGSAAEHEYSGRGHHFLGNTRRVFEQYYLDRRVLDPPVPPALPTAIYADPPAPR